MIMREVIRFVKGESEVVPQSSFGGLALAVLLFFVLLFQACTLQHFIQGGKLSAHLASFLLYLHAPSRCRRCNNNAKEGLVVLSVYATEVAADLRTLLPCVAITHSPSSSATVNMSR